MWRSAAALSITALGLLGLVLIAYGSGRTATGPRVGAPAPDFRLPKLGGDTVELRALCGRPVMLYFFATWCPSCRFELPMLDAARREHAGRGLVVLLVNLQGSPEHVRGFVDGWRFGGPVALDGEGVAARRYEVQTLPTTFFVARDGTLRGAHRGPLTTDALDAALARILAGGGR